MSAGVKWIQTKIENIFRYLATVNGKISFFRFEYLKFRTWNANKRQFDSEYFD